MWSQWEGGRFEKSSSSWGSVRVIFVRFPDLWLKSRVSRVLYFLSSFGECDVCGGCALLGLSCVTVCFRRRICSYSVTRRPRPSPPPTARLRVPTHSRRPRRKRVRGQLLRELQLHSRHDRPHRQRLRTRERRHTLGLPAQPLQHVRHKRVHDPHPLPRDLLLALLELHLRQLVDVPRVLPAVGGRRTSQLARCQRGGSVLAKSLKALKRRGFRDFFRIFLAKPRGETPLLSRIRMSAPCWRSTSRTSWDSLSS